MDAETYAGYLEILAGRPAPPKGADNKAEVGRLRSFLVFARLREDLADMAFSVRQLEQEAAALLDRPPDKELRDLSRCTNLFVAAMADDPDGPEVLKHAAKLRQSVLALLRYAAADLPDWAVPQEDSDEEEEDR
ncbi:hypothetical protein [Actinoplanes sp. L3-i22]|uniref:hypothetical protein n=1 Tax=Actinoplanes sp. L3-i22 TaxID=2836373 RepID=UPI001C75E001|nr:hypothetical protein [Actinoplanes sp. L3-i22]BCY07323.1 hypothetical protein L3i22_024110 [Actinoplanes sp. L3-i22]